MANILWIEDDANMIMGLIRPLLKDGHRVDIAYDAENGKRKISEKKFDLIILDMILPSGIQMQSLEDLENVERFYGLKILEYIQEISSPIPVLSLSVVTEKETLEIIESYPFVKKCLLKGTIRPSQLKEEVIGILEGKQ